MSAVRLRQHQLEIQDKGDLIRDGDGSSILAHVVPGGGKSWLPLLLRERLSPDTKIAWFVPRDNLRKQAAMCAAQHFGATLHDCGNQLRPADGPNVIGFVTTHQGLIADTRLWTHELLRHPYLLVVDELHHASINPHDNSHSALATALLSLPRKYVLFMTGTLNRHDNKFIFGLEYAHHEGQWLPEIEASADHSIAYGRMTALQEGAIIPIEFHHYDGTLSYYDPRQNDTIDIESLADLNGDAALSALFVALNTEYADHLRDACLEHWMVHGQKLLVVCARQTDAKRQCSLLKKRCRHTYLAITENEDASLDIQAFRATEDRAILVTCAMAYEGLDVPAISHICSLTQIRSAPWIYQMLARAWRPYPGKSIAHCFCPDDSRMNAVIATIREEQLQAIRTMEDLSSSDRVREDRQELLPLTGAASHARRSALDGDVETTAQKEFAALLSRCDLDLNDPVLRAAWYRLGGIIQPHVSSETHGEKLLRLRKQLHRLCCARDKVRKQEPGTTQKAVFMRMNGLRVDEMTETDLLRAFREASRI